MKLTVPETAELLGVRDAEVRDWIRHRRLPAIHVQDRTYIHRARLAEWAREQGMALSPAVFAVPHSNADLAAAWRVGGLVTLTTPTTPTTGARAVAEALPLPPTVDRSTLAAILAARLDLGLLVDRDGIARPRLSEPIVAGPPALVLFDFTPFWALTTGPVHRAFFLVSPSVGAHQHVLAELDAALTLPETRAAVLRAAGPAVADLLHVPSAAK